MFGEVTERPKVRHWKCNFHLPAPFLSSFLFCPNLLCRLDIRRYILNASHWLPGPNR